jgi:hypothetical protein
MLYSELYNLSLALENGDSLMLLDNCKRNNGNITLLMSNIQVEKISLLVGRLGLDLWC